MFALEAQAMLQEGDPSDAVELCKLGLTCYPDNIAGYATLAQAYLALGEEERAANVLQAGFRRTGARELVLPEGNEEAPEIAGADQTMPEENGSEVYPADAVEYHDDIIEPAAVAEEIDPGLSDIPRDTDELQDGSAEPEEVSESEKSDDTSVMGSEELDVEADPAIMSTDDLTDTEAPEPHEQVSEENSAAAVPNEPRWEETEVETEAGSAEDEPTAVPEHDIAADETAATIDASDDSPSEAIGKTEEDSPEPETEGSESVGEEEVPEEPQSARSDATIAATPSSDSEQEAPKEEESRMPRSDAKERKAVRETILNPTRRERPEPIGLSLHSGTNISRLRSSNLRLIPGLEFAPLRRDREEKLRIAPLVNEAPPSFSDTDRSGDIPSQGESASKSRIDFSGVQVPGMGRSTDSGSEVPEGSDPLDELARKLENARIPVVEEEHEEVEEPPYEHSIVSDTIAEILARQGAYIEAIDAFETLSRLKPERKEIYLRRIEELRRKMAERRSDDSPND